MTCKNYSNVLVLDCMNGIRSPRWWNASVEKICCKISWLKSKMIFPLRWMINVSTCSFVSNECHHNTFTIHGILLAPINNVQCAPINNKNTLKNADVDIEFFMSSLTRIHVYVHESRSKKYKIATSHRRCRGKSKSVHAPN